MSENFDVGAFAFLRTPARASIGLGVLLLAIELFQLGYEGRTVDAFRGFVVILGLVLVLLGIVLALLRVPTPRWWPNPPEWR